MIAKLTYQENATYSNVAKELNISIMTIKRNERLKQAIYNAKRELGIE
jgi:DNA-directed RNA polymerase specialized sigma subunit